MTYCVGLKIDRGLVFMSDTRTNAGIDSISTFRKMHVWEKPGERVVVLMSAGNLATTQAVVSLLEGRAKAVGERSSAVLETPSMYQTARLIGDTVKQVIASSSPSGQKADSYFNASFVLGGQVQRLGAAPVHDLPGRQFHRIDRRHAILPGGRDQIRQADHRADLRQGDEPRRDGEAPAGVL